MRLPYRLSMLTLCVGAAAVQAATPSIPHYDHVVVVVMSAHSYANIRASSSAPYINGPLIVNGASFTSSYAVADPAQPN